MTKPDPHFCCICGKMIDGYGHNPHPIVKAEGYRCCDKCNDKVLVARVYMAIKHKDREIMKGECQ